MATSTITEGTDRFAVVATVDGRTQLWGTASGHADPERLVRAFLDADFGPHSGNHLRVMAWTDWKRLCAGLLDVEDGLFAGSER